MALGCSHQPPVTISAENAAHLRKQDYFPPLPYTPWQIKKTDVGQFRICVDELGYVLSVRVVDSTGSREIDETLIEAMKMWKYAPLYRGSVAIPFCHPFKLTYETRPLPQR
jgi:TonB family protein